MPFKRAGWLQLPRGSDMARLRQFQCPLSGLVGCNTRSPTLMSRLMEFQCPLSGLVGCNARDRAVVLLARDVSMPFKRAGWLQPPPYEHVRAPQVSVSMPFKRAGWLQPPSREYRSSSSMFQCPLSGLVGCNEALGIDQSAQRKFQCPLSGLVGCNAHRARQLSTGRGFNAL